MKKMKKPGKAVPTGGEVQRKKRLRAECEGDPVLKDITLSPLCKEDNPRHLDNLSTIYISFYLSQSFCK